MPLKTAELPFAGTYRHDNDAEDNEEYVVPVEWITAVDRSDAVWEKGFFVNRRGDRQPGRRHAGPSGCVLPARSARSTR
ncbi:MAG: hypothetical protein HYX32_08040 [Actinobacteria bacterium]|nr:hypothetical protein [Actinomycetota bacterium]